MDQSRILDGSSTSHVPAGSGARMLASADRGSAIAVAPGLYPVPSTLQSEFAGTESLAEMASRDLDAALQLLAERAQYITDASGAAIALRRGEHNDMFCRASAGSSAPELGALLSMEYGLSGESVRTREIQRCDDAQNDARVNREGCRRLGIASVIVMPIISEDQVCGVFELFSGKPYAFDERDLSALQRLGAMVAMTLKFALPEQPLLPLQKSPVEARTNKPVLVAAAIPESKATSQASSPNLASVARAGAMDPAIQSITPPKEATSELQPATPSAKTAEPVPKKPAFWSVATPDRTNPTLRIESAPSVPIPPVMRNLQKCQACGFPVSQGRKLCIECEEKEWRGQRSR